MFPLPLKCTLAGRLRNELKNLIAFVDHWVALVNFQNLPENILYRTQMFDVDVIFVVSFWLGKA